LTEGEIHRRRAAFTLRDPTEETTVDPRIIQLYDEYTHKP
jgi:hypothetical protein